jgi:hypothetical protein
MANCKSRYKHKTIKFVVSPKRKRTRQNNTNVQSFSSLITQHLASQLKERSR